MFLQLCSSCIETFFTCLDCFADQVVNLLLLGEEFHGLGLQFIQFIAPTFCYISLHFRLVERKKVGLWLKPFRSRPCGRLSFVLSFFAAN